MSRKKECPTMKTAPADRPNIIFIVADDLGYADLGCYGGRAPVSPVLDALAERGIRFDQGYANSPVCSPTRFALMTVRYQYHLRGAAEEPINSKSRGSAELGLPADCPTLPSRLRAAGYRTALVGKWHLGYPPTFGPLKSGYDEFFGPMSGGVDYFTHCDTGGTHDLWQSSEPVTEDGYLTDLFSRKAVDFIERAAPAADATPFFLSLHYTAPHWPWETRDDQDMAMSQELRANLFHHGGGNIHAYRKMIHHMDEGIGWIVDALKKKGLLDNTLIVFTSDNGGERFSDNWPLVGGKLYLTEGGIRVPWIAHWPAVIAAGRQSAQQCMTMDWSATMLDAAGILPRGATSASSAIDESETPIDPDSTLDGVSLLAVLRGTDPPFRRRMHWRMKHRGQRALRDGDWKYLRVDGHDYLFNLAEDERERANRATHQPLLLDAMRADWEAWNATMPEIPADASVLPGYSAKDMPQR
jgi:arylsulfatase A-like enzyme